MKIVNEPDTNKGKSMKTEKFEFRSCGGSIEPDEKTGAKKDEAQHK